ncbi:hypothetical protein SADUNF_Sadunf10G0055900 [Salix dunnii]|uniref:Uncharacterized protein n=1 Tax=Salix dunnii TaxID=1413687 RepID=A0A835MRE4_9ROSI|nr:hypothetical protein SADUNF_Sadunf10G0055900 [Salix dunnii]
MYDLLVQRLRKRGKLKYACCFFQEVVLKGLAPYDKTYKIWLGELEREYGCFDFYFKMNPELVEMALTSLRPKKVHQYRVHYLSAIVSLKT